MYYLQANFPGRGWSNVFSTPMTKEEAQKAMMYGERDNPDLEFRLVEVVSS